MKSNFRKLRYILPLVLCLLVPAPVKADMLLQVTITTTNLTSYMGPLTVFFQMLRDGTNVLESPRNLVTISDFEFGGGHAESGAVTNYGGASGNMAGPTGQVQLADSAIVNVHSQRFQPGNQFQFRALLTSVRSFNGPASFSLYLLGTNGLPIPTTSSLDEFLRIDLDDLRPALKLFRSDLSNTTFNIPQPTIRLTNQPNAPQFKLTVTTNPGTNGNLRLDFPEAKFADLFELEASVDLRTWTNLGPRAYVGESLIFSDPDRTNFPIRFYRAKMLNAPQSIQSAPLITSQPESRTNVIGTAATFTVVASGISPLSYQWRRGGVDLVDGGSVFGVTNSTLTLSPASFSDASIYDVVVTNFFGAVTSAPARLFVVASPIPAGTLAWWQAESNALDSVGTNDGILAHGMTFAPGKAGFGFLPNGGFMEVPDAPSLRPAQVTVMAWTKLGSGYLLSKSLQQGIASYALYTVGSAIYFFIGHTNGTYTQSPGAVVSDTDFHHVTGVYDGNRVRMYLDGAEVGSGTIANNAIAYGTNFWGGSLYVGGYNGNSDYIWGSVMDEVAIFNRGLSSNEIAQIYQQVIIATLPPRVVAQPQSWSSGAGMIAGFSVVATGTAPLDYRWLRNGAALNDGGRVSGAATPVLTLTNVQVTDAGWYTVVITNAYGCVTSAPVTLSILAPLQNATATASFGPYPPSEAIDGITTGDQGWSLDSGGSPATIVFETQTNVGFAGGSLLTFRLYQGTSLPNYPNYQLGRFRLSVTTDDRSTFADGLENGGDVTANWVVLEPVSYSAANGATLTKQPDNSLLASGGTMPTIDTIYTVTALAALTNITGFRLEALTHPSLPNNGPGRSSIGNFELQEFQISIAPIQNPQP